MSDKKTLEIFSAWALVVTHAAIRNQDKTIRQLVQEEIIPSWAKYLLDHTR